MVEIFKTDDGSHSLKDKRFNETYHSDKGAVQESMHVFIERGLLFVAGQQKYEIRVLEMGFGTGLNAVLSFIHRPAHTNLLYTSVEAFPLSTDVLNGLAYHSFLNVEENTTQKIMQAPYNETTQVNDRFSLHKVHGSFLDFDSTEKFDLVYYDAFGPKTQPELWTVECMQKCYRLLKPGGVLVTYCSQGQFRRNLKEAGFVAEKMPGPPGKREMTRAIKPL